MTLPLGLYVLDEHGEPVPCDDVITWGHWYATAERHVAHDMDEGQGADRVRVSTVFLGLDHSFGSGPPVLWESMVFGGPLDGEQQRYTSRADALRGHAEMCALVTAARDAG